MVIYLEVAVMVRLCFKSKTRRHRDKPSYRGSNDVVSMFDGGSITIPKGSLNPLYNHSNEDIANVKNKAGNEPISREEFMEQFET